VRALEAVRHAADDILHNVTPQLALEVMLLAVKEAL
jgi:DNA polymerase-3 subunit delta'